MVGVRLDASNDPLLEGVLLLLILLVFLVISHDTLIFPAGARSLLFGCWVHLGAPRKITSSLRQLVPQTHGGV